MQQTVQTPAVQPTKTKSPLPDVQEEPLEREEEDHTVVPDQTDASRIEITYRDDDEGEFGLYDCLCKLRRRYVLLVAVSDCDT